MSESAKMSYWQLYTTLDLCCLGPERDIEGTVHSSKTLYFNTAINGESILY